uniref:Putative polynucleotide kinase 3'-phosphatase n=1 Tax=Trypanosoma vivax (strain Y486) TaxID=1055687 RepID=G0TWG9_TRYVY|nr:putative polynucleotide kinase 3'-phosphatase [Trypanosoma vivax Y486]
MKRVRSPSHSAILDAALPIPVLSDWKLLHDSVLALLPTADLVRRSLARAGAGAGRRQYLKVAAFDMDDTLITPLSGAVFPHDDPKDWKWLTPSVPGCLRHLYDAGFMVVVLSNQAGIGGKKWNEKKADAVKRKILLLSESLNVPFTALLSTKDNEWRKPSVGMWNLLEEHIRSTVKEDVAIDGQQRGFVFYVGDAAGRTITTLAGRKRDFSCSDRKFALNIGVPFLTPEQLYLHPLTQLLDDDKTEGVVHTQQESCAGKRLSESLLLMAEAPCNVNWCGVSPDELHQLPKSYDNLVTSRLTASGTKEVVRLSSPPVFHRAAQEMILFVGFPGCGKTTFFNRFLKPAGYAHVNRDLLKSKEKCLAEASKWWKAGKSVVIDNTSPSHDDCKPFIDLVKQTRRSTVPLPVRLFHFQVSRGMAEHMSAVRARIGIAPRISRVAYNVYQSKFQPWSAETCGR